MDQHDHFDSSEVGPAIASIRIVQLVTARRRCLTGVRNSPRACYIPCDEIVLR